MSDETTEQSSASPEWMSHAACRGLGPDLFFPDHRGEAIDPQALELCYGCPVRGECLDHAILYREEGGCWGGTSSRDRRQLRRADKRRLCLRCQQVFTAQRSPDRFCSGLCRDANRRESNQRHRGTA